MTLIGRKILLTNTDASGNPTLDFPITSIECVEGGASQGNLEALQSQLMSLSELVGTLKSQVDNFSTNLDDVSDYIVEKYRDGVKWYRVWKSGWVEQGGGGTATAKGYITVALLKQMADADYFASVSNFTKDLAEASAVYDNPTDLTTTNFKTYVNTDQFKVYRWYVCGQGA